MAETRNSASIGSALADLVFGTITTFTADLAVTKAVSNPKPTIGDTITFTVTLTNNGPNNATGVSVSDPLPAGLAFVSATPSQGTYDSTTGLWTVGNVARGQALTLQLVATVVSPDARTNTATVAGLNERDPDPTNNQASATETPQIADLSITKTDGVTSAVPGTPTTYTLVVSNAGPVAVTGATVSDPLPAGVTAATWAATASSGGRVTGPSGGSGALATTVDLPVGATVTFTFTVQIDPSATGSLSNTATVTPPAGMTDPTPGNNSATDTDTLTPQADLAVTKTDGVTSAVPGTPNTYTVVVSNQGPSAVSGVSVSDPLPAGVTAATWAATASSGTGALATTVNLPVNATVTFTFTVQVSPSATGSLSNTATVTPPAGVTDPTPADNSATDVDNLTPSADLSITKDDGVTSVVPGTSTTYTLVVSNAGPSTAVNQPVTDFFPSAITAVSWTAVASPGSSVAAASGTSNINTTVTLLPGGTVTFTAVAQISPGVQREVVSLVNTATVARPAGDTTPGNNSATDTDSLTPQAGLSITKTDGQTTAVPGTPTTYTLVVSNAGPSTATGAALSDPLPAGVTAATWAFAGATGGGVVTGPTTGSGALATTVNLPVGATITFGFTVQVDPSATGSLVNTATVTPPGGTPAGATDTDSLTPRADLSVTKTDGVTEAVPGTLNTYTITVSNQGPSTVSRVILTDAVPAALLDPVFTPSAGSYDPATGLWTGLSLAQGQSVSITLTGTIDPAATGSLTNTAHVSPPPGVTDPTPGNNNATDTDTLTPRADLAVTKTDGQTSAVPGTPVTYTIVVSNAGPSTVSSLILTDAVPADLLDPVFGPPSAGSYDPATGVWSGLSLAQGQSVSITLTGTIDPAATGSLSNTATVTPPAGTTDPDPSDNSATDVDTLTPSADLSITKADGQTSAVPGLSTTYTITVSNAGPSAVTGASVADPLPAGVTAAAWAFAGATGGGSVSGPASGTGALATTVNLPAGATVTFTFTVQVSPSATGSLTNTATVSPPAGTTDPNPADNGDSDTDTLTPQADLAVNKSVSDATPNVGDTITFTVTLTNTGPSNATGVQVTELLPAGLNFVSSNPSQGTYDPNAGLWSVGTVDLGSPETLVILARVVSPGSYTNTATITHADQHDPSPANNANGVVVIATSEVTPVAPPSVTSLQRFGFHAQPTAFVLTFSSALDPTRAQDPHNYTLRPVGPKGHVGERIPIVAAVYNPLADAVTIHPVHRLYLFRSYKLVVNGMPPDGLASPSGILLDGQGTGVPGTNYVKVFDRAILAGPYRRVAPQRNHEIRRLSSAHPQSSTTPLRSHRAASGRHIERTQPAAPKGGLGRLPADAVDAVLGTLVSPLRSRGRDRTESRSQD